MGVLLERVNSLSIDQQKIDFQLGRWLFTLIDSLNTTFEQIESYLLSLATISDVTQQADNNSEYIPTNIALTSITLPTVSPIGSKINIYGQGSGGWSLLTNAGQTIQVAATTATTSVASAEQYDAISVVCVVANTTWIVVSSSTTGFVIT